MDGEEKATERDIAHHHHRVTVRDTTIDTGDRGQDPQDMEETDTEAAVHVVRQMMICLSHVAMDPRCRKCKSYHLIQL